MKLLKNKKIASFVPLASRWDVNTFGVTLLIFNGILFLFLKFTLDESNADIRQILISGTIGMCATLLVRFPIRADVEERHYGVLLKRISELRVLESFRNDTTIVFTPKGHRWFYWDADRIVIKRKDDTNFEITLPLRLLRRLSIPVVD